MGKVQVRRDLQKQFEEWVAAGEKTQQRGRKRKTENDNPESDKIRSECCHDVAQLKQGLLLQLFRYTLRDNVVYRYTPSIRDS